MCGIAGYSVGTESQIDRTLAAQALLAGIADSMFGQGAEGFATLVSVTGIGASRLRRPMPSTLLVSHMPSARRVNVPNEMPFDVRALRSPRRAQSPTSPAARAPSRAGSR